MQLAKKKALAARVLKVGKDRIVFSELNKSEIKEAITRQDILDLNASGAITIKEKKGRKKIVKRKNRRRVGKIKKKMKKKRKKQEYVKITRKLRKFARFLFKTESVDKEKHQKIRKMIRARKFKSKRHLNDSYKEL